MPQISGGFFVELKIRGTVIDQEMVNVFHFHSVTFAEPLADMINGFWTNVGTLWRNLVSTGVVFTQIDGQEIGGAGAFASVPLGVSGFVSGDCLPPYAAWDFTYMRGAALERNGYKRLAGVPESYQASGIASSTGQSQAGLVAAAFFTHVALGIADDWEPVIRRRKIGHVVQTPPKFFSVSNVVYSRIGTQNSRKFGHGR